MKTRLILFRSAWWLPMTAIMIACALIWRAPSSPPTSALIPVAALILGFCYFAQRQHLDELRLFKELFVEFNARYDALNDDLLDIRNGVEMDDRVVRKKLADYFNLCAEEFFFFRQGYIHDDVWRSWCRGILYFFERDSIRSIWESEVEQDSYYGLSLAVIRKGAGSEGAPHGTFDHGSNTPRRKPLLAFSCFLAVIASASVGVSAYSMRKMQLARFVDIFDKLSFEATQTWVIPTLLILGSVTSVGLLIFIGFCHMRSKPDLQRCLADADQERSPGNQGDKLIGEGTRVPLLR